MDGDGPRGRPPGGVIVLDIGLRSGAQHEVALPGTSHPLGGITGLDDRRVEAEGFGEGQAGDLNAAVDTAGFDAGKERGADAGFERGAGETVGRDGAGSDRGPVGRALALAPLLYESVLEVAELRCGAAPIVEQRHVAARPGLG